MAMADWKSGVVKMMGKLAPTTVTAEQQATADAYAAKEKREKERMKREATDAKAKKDRLTWSPMSRNAETMKKAMEDE